MKDHTPKLTDHDILQHARARLEQHLPLQADGYLCTTSDLFNLLIGTAATRDSLESVCSDLTAAPKAATLRAYLNAQAAGRRPAHFGKAVEPCFGRRDPKVDLCRGT